METFRFFLFLMFLGFTSYTEGTAQTSNLKPTITTKSVSKQTTKPTTKSGAKSAKLSKKTASVPTKAARIRFENAFIDLGTIKEDAIIEKSFEFTNIGERDLVVIDAKGSCGCTIPVAPTEPIPPGGKGKILVKYTARNKVGPQKPVVTVTTNGIPSIIKLNMEVWVDQIPGGVN